MAPILGPAYLYRIENPILSLSPICRPTKTMDALDVPVTIMSAPHPSNPVQHFPELCTTCVARLQRHHPEVIRQSSVASSTDSRSDTIDATSQPQPETYESALEAPPPYSRRRRYQRLEVDPPAYTDVLALPPPGVRITTIPVTVRYTETLVLEDDGYSKVVCPTARKFRAHVKIYESMEWNRFWECLRQVKPSVTTRKDGLKDVRAFRRKGKWERMVFTRLTGARLSEANWEEIRTAICEGDIDKITVAV